MPELLPALALRDRGFQTIAYDAFRDPQDPPARSVPTAGRTGSHDRPWIVDVLGLPDAHVLGVSFGGVVAQELGSATATGSAGSYSPPRCVASVGSRATRLHWLLATPMRYYSPRFLQSTARVMYGPFVDANGALMRQQVRARRSCPPTFWGYLSQLYGYPAGCSLPWLHRITAPTLIVNLVGRTRSSRRQRGSSRRWIPEATVHVVPDAGHLVLMDHAAECADVVGGFFAAEVTTPHLERA